MQKDLEIFKQMQKSPRFFIKVMWGLVPQPSKDVFVKGHHITWQQNEILQAAEDAIAGIKPARISVASAHGIGKSATIAWLLLWYLFCFKECQIACTAPTSDQMHDVLWKEVAKWIQKMPEDIQKKYEWSNGYVRITENPTTWFARAKTARKENPEALAGIHADNVMILVDEASGVFDEIYNVGEGALTSGNTLVILISNPTRLIGYFYETHHKYKDKWQTLQFSSLDSPIVDSEYNTNILEKHGEESDEYRIRVLGQFPRADSVDDKGFVPLFEDSEIKISELGYLMGDDKRMGVDPSGEGQDITAYVGRDQFKAMVFGKEAKSNAKSTAQTILSFMAKYNITDRDVMVDSFGVGADVGKEVALSTRDRVGTINVGEKATDDIFLNVRAEAFWRMKEWFSRGGSIYNDPKGLGKKLKEELLKIRFRRNENGKIQIMSKLEMKKQGIESPNLADALMLTFCKKQSSALLKAQAVGNKPQAFNKWSI